MKSSAGSALFAALAAIVAGVLLPGIVHACPMCFAGGNENQDAFLYGSLFLMIVPTATLGGLGYWVYRRLKAIDAGLVDPELDEPAHQQAEQPQQRGSAVVLQLPSRR